MLRVLILAGGISPERDISLKSGRRLSDHLAEAGVENEIREPDELLIDYVATTKPDLVWSVLHGAGGEDGSIQRLLEMLGVAYVGANSENAKSVWNKATAKTLVQNQNIQTPAWIALPKNTFKQLNAKSVLDVVSESIGFPLITKPIEGGSAQGVNKSETAKELGKSMVEAYAYCDEVLIEKFIGGTELAITVVDFGNGLEALPAVEIIADSGKFGYEERYIPGETTFYAPARLDPRISQKASEMAIKAHEALSLGVFGRIDLVIDQNNQPWFLEASVIPGLTETSLAPQAFMAAGWTLGDAYKAVAESAISHQSRR
jgi:D-alanine-D-alanine ligase